MGYYDTAQICLNGHIINSSSNSSIELNQKFCDKCGAETITNCPKCNSSIHGEYVVPYVVSFSSMETAPNYCHNCGAAYPWTELALESTEELLAIEDTLTEDELAYFHDNMDSLIVDTPKSKVVATKFKLALSKISASTGSAIRDIIVDIASESVKKIIFPE